jgi:glucose/arabinose dehydrogenase
MQKSTFTWLIVGVSLLTILLLGYHYFAPSATPPPIFSPSPAPSAREKENLIRVRTVSPGDTVQSPLTVEGEARGTWFFEASFPVRLLDGNGKEIAVTPAQAQGEWTTQDFVPFRATLEFAPPQTREGMLVLEKDNPSGLPEYADELRIPVRFAGVGAGERPDIETAVENLAIPWEIAFLPEGELLVTERSGQLLKIGREKKSIPIQGVRHQGEGGLLGLALHPRFAENHWLYLYLTTGAGAGLANRVERYRLEDDTLIDRKPIIENIPGASNHDGGRIAFGPDGYLYVTTGDASKSNLAQNKNSLAGKILRLTDDGLIPEDNPFGNAVYSYGHRNPQGLTWDNQGRLWATEHGRSGLLSGLDELNLIERGVNYGWPTIQGNEQKEGMRTPVINSGPRETWAPASALFYQGSIFFTGLRGESLYKATISPEGNVTPLKKYLTGQFGRLRGLVLGPDGFFYISTSNQDGRGEPRAGDDKIIRINPRILQSL